MASDHEPDTISFFCFGFRTPSGELHEHQIDTRLAGTWEKAEERFRFTCPDAEVEYRRRHNENRTGG